MTTPIIYNNICSNSSKLPNSILSYQLRWYIQYFAFENRHNFYKILVNFIYHRKTTVMHSRVRWSKRHRKYKNAVISKNVPALVVEDRRKFKKVGDRTGFLRNPRIDWKTLAWWEIVQFLLNDHTGSGNFSYKAKKKRKMP